METNDTGLNHQVRAYFLEQGKSIVKLYNILDSNIFLHHVKKWMSVLAELCLYLVFVFILTVAILIPTDISFYSQIDSQTNVEVVLRNHDFRTDMMILKILIVIFSIPVLLFAFLLGRNRKKNSLIREAFYEVEKMKSGFDGAVRDLKL